MVNLWVSPPAVYLANDFWICKSLKKKSRFGHLHLSYPYFSRAIFEDDGIGHPDFHEVVLKKGCIIFWQSWANHGSCPKKHKRRTWFSTWSRGTTCFWQPMWEIMMVKACYFTYCWNITRMLHPSKQHPNKKSCLCWHCPSSNHMFLFITCLTTSPMKLFYKR